MKQPPINIKIIKMVDWVETANKGSPYIFPVYKFAAKEENHTIPDTSISINDSPIRSDIKSNVVPIKSTIHTPAPTNDPEIIQPISIRFLLLIFPMLIRLLF